MTGYQETVTDPSYAEQLVCFTAPMVGNYGVDESRLESAAPHARAVVMRRLGGEDWALWLAEQGVVALDEIDTRTLTLRLRDEGAMRAVAVADERAFPVPDALDHVRAQPTMEGAALVAQVSTPAPYVAEPEATCGSRWSTTGRSAPSSAGSRAPAPGSPRSRTLPIPTSSRHYDGVLLSNGPGDPAPLVEETAVVRATPRPRAGARDLPRAPAARAATGHETVKLPFGHRGANHPVLDRRSGRFLVTSQNHGFAVAPTDGVEATHVSLYDGTVEGFAFPELRRPRASSSTPRRALARRTPGPSSRAGSRTAGVALPR